MKDKKNLKLLVSIVIVIIISALTLNCFSVLVKDKFSDTRFLDRQNPEEFYSVKKDTVDVLAIGTSQVLSGFCAPELYINHGISAYGLATCNQPLLGSYYWLLEALKTQSPKVVLLEMAGLYGQREEEEISFFKAVSPMKNTSKYKLEAVNAISELFKSTDKLSYYSDLYKFHSRWEEIEKKDYSFLKDFKRPTFGGAAVINTVTKNTLDYDTYYVETVDDVTLTEPEASAFYFNKIAELCREKGIELILFKTPKSTWNSDYYTNVSKYAAQFGVPYIDFNTKELLTSLNLDFDTDFVDPNHFTATGAQKLTAYLGKYLVENYELTDHRGDKKYKSYDKTSQKYLQAFNSAIISGSDDLSEILTLAKDKNYSIVIAKGGDFDTSAVDDKIQQLGFAGSLSDSKNVLLSFENGKLIKQAASEGKITMTKYYSDKISYQIYHKDGKTSVGIFGSFCKVKSSDDYIAVGIYDNIANYIVYLGAFDADLNKK